MGNKVSVLEQEMKVNPDSIKLNPDLTEKDLKIIFPVGTSVYDKTLDLHFRVGDKLDYTISELAKSVSEQIKDTTTPKNNIGENKKELYRSNSKTDINNAAVSEESPIPLTKAKKTNYGWLVVCIVVIALLSVYTLVSRNRKG